MIRSFFPINRAKIMNINVSSFFYPSLFLLLVRCSSVVVNVGSLRLLSFCIDFLNNKLSRKRPTKLVLDRFLFFTNIISLFFTNIISLFFTNIISMIQYTMLKIDKARLSFFSIFQKNEFADKKLHP